MDLTEILQALTDYASDPDPKAAKDKQKEIANAFRSKDRPALNPVAQLLLNAGAARQKGEGQERSTHLEGEVERLTTELAQAKIDVEAARGEPEERYKILERKHEKLEQQFTEATAALTEERNGRVEDKTELYVDKVLAKLTGRIESDYLDETVRGRVRKQIRVKADKSIDLLPPGDEVPYDAATSEEAIPQLAEDIYQGVKPLYRISKSEPGGGGGGDRGGGKQPTLEDNKKKLQRTGLY